MRTVGLTLAGLVALGLAANTAQAADGPKRPAHLTLAAQFGGSDFDSIHEVRGYGGHHGSGHHARGHHGRGHYRHGPPPSRHHYYRPHYGGRYYAPYRVYPPVPSYRYHHYSPYRGMYYGGRHFSFGIGF